MDLLYRSLQGLMQVIIVKLRELLEEDNLVAMNQTQNMEYRQLMIVEKHMNSWIDLSDQHH